MQTKTVNNPGFSDKQFTRQKFVDRWVNWSKDFGKIAGSLDEATKFEEKVKELAGKQFDA
jgi:hypothetical protein